MTCAGNGIIPEQVTGTFLCVMGSFSGEAYKSHLRIICKMPKIKCIGL